MKALDHCILTLSILMQIKQLQTHSPGVMKGARWTGILSLLSVKMLISGPMKVKLPMPTHTGSLGRKTSRIINATCTTARKSCPEFMEVIY